MQSPSESESDAAELYARATTLIAEQGHMASQEEADRLLQAAAEAGHADAAFDLGRRYELGRSGKADFGAAVTWYEMAAHRGHPAAQNNLGKMVEEGRGTTADRMQARQWYEKSKAGGNKWAALNLERLAAEEAAREQTTSSTGKEAPPVTPANDRMSVHVMSTLPVPGEMPAMSPASAGFAWEATSSSPRPGLTTFQKIKEFFARRLGLRAFHYFKEIAIWGISLFIVVLFLGALFTLDKNSGDGRNHSSEKVATRTEGNNAGAVSDNSSSQSYSSGDSISDISPITLSLDVGERVMVQRKSVICPSFNAASLFYAAWSKAERAHDRIGMKDAVMLGRYVGCTWDRPADAEALLIGVAVNFPKSVHPMPYWIPQFFQGLYGDVYAQIRLEDGNIVWVLPAPLAPLETRN